MSVTSDMVRKMFKEGDDERDAGLTTPEDILRFDDILYGEDKKWQLLDVYRPKECKGKLPVIVSVHGGGWVYGDKERYQYYCMNLAQRGFAVVNFTYRLAPEFQYPASLEDTNLVFTWVLANSEKYGFDTDNIYAVGDSAGAHNLGLYTANCTNEEYAKKYSFKVPKDFVPKAVALNCGAYRISLDDSVDDLTKALMSDFLPEKGTIEELNLIDVVKHVTKDFPPVFLMTATGDFLLNQAPILMNQLMDKEVPFVFRFYGNATYQLGHVFHLNMKMEEAHQCNYEECKFFMSFYNNKGDDEIYGR